MEIPLDLARTLLAVVDAGTMDAAAQQLRLTPSAVSQRIKSLEQQFGRVLLVRSKPVGVTDAGAALVRLARQVALLEHGVLVDVGDAGDGMTAIPLAINADSLSTWILPALASAAQRHAVVFDIRREDQDFTAELLERGEVMAAVTSRQRPVAGCTASFLGAMRYRAVATAAFRDTWLSPRADAVSLASAPAVYFDRRDDLQERALAGYGVQTPPPRHFIPSSNDFAMAVRLGLGWGMLPDAQCVAELAAGSLVELTPEAVIEVPLYWQQWNLDSALLSAVAEEVAASARAALVR